MQKAKAFFYVSLGILALAVAFHLGARSAQGQSANVVATSWVLGSGVAVAAENGDVYLINPPSGYFSQFIGNVFTSTPPIPTTQTTWGRIKAEGR